MDYDREFETDAILSIGRRGLPTLSWTYRTNLDPHVLSGRPLLRWCNVLVYWDLLPGLLTNAISCLKILSSRVGRDGFAWASMNPSAPGSSQGNHQLFQIAVRNHHEQELGKFVVRALRRLLRRLGQECRRRQVEVRHRQGRLGVASQLST